MNLYLKVLKTNINNDILVYIMIKIAHRGSCYSYNFLDNEISNCIKFNENTLLSYLILRQGQEFYDMFVGQ